MKEVDTPWLTSLEVQEILGISARALDALCEQKRIPWYELPEGQARFHRDDIEAMRK